MTTIDILLHQVNGLVISQCSDVLLDLVTKSPDVCLDLFVGDLPGVKDCIMFLYGGEVQITTNNIQTIVKFSAMFEVKNLFELCFDWIEQNIRSETLFTFITTGLMVENLENLNGGDNRVLSTCTAFIKNNIQNNLLGLSKSWSLADNDLIKYFIQEDILMFTLPVLTQWVESDAQIKLLLDQFEAKGTDLCRYGGRGNELVERFSDKVETLETSKRIIKLKVSSTMPGPSSWDEPLGQAGDKDYRTNRLTVEARLCLARKPWERLSGQPLLDHLSIIAECNYPLFIDVCINTKQENTLRALVPTIDPDLLGAQYKCNIQRLITESGLFNYRPQNGMSFTYTSFQLQASTSSWFLDYYTGSSPNYALTYYQGADLVAGRPTTFLFDCRVPGCTLIGKHAVTIKLSENETELPSYDQNVENTAPTGSHVHLSSVVHWYIRSDGIVAVKRWSFVSLATQTSKEVKDELNQIIRATWSNNCNTQRKISYGYDYDTRDFPACNIHAFPGYIGFNVGFNIGCILDIRP